MSDTAAKRRAQQTVINLLLSLAASLGVMLLVIFVVPRNDSNLIQKVDYASIAVSTSKTVGHPLIAPKLPKDWWSNSARWQTAKSDGVASWYVGFVGPKGQYIGITQAFETNPTWLAFQTKGDLLVKNTQLGNASWAEYRNPAPGDSPKTRDHIYVLELPSSGITLLMYGTASNAEFAAVASQIATQTELVAN